MFLCLFVGVCVPASFCVRLSRWLFCFLSKPFPPPFHFVFPFFFALFLIVVFFLMRLN